MYGQKGNSFTLPKCSFTDSTVITKSVTVLEKIYLFAHVPQTSDFSMPGTQNGNGSFSTCCSRNSALHLYRAAWPKIWDQETKLSLGQSSQCKGVTPGQHWETFPTATSSLFPSSLGGDKWHRQKNTWVPDPQFLWELCVFRIVSKPGITALPRKVMTACTSNIDRLYSILHQWYSEISLSLHKHPNL